MLALIDLAKRLRHRRHQAPLPLAASEASTTNTNANSSHTSALVNANVDRPATGTLNHVFGSNFCHR